MNAEEIRQGVEAAVENRDWHKLFGLTDMALNTLQANEDKMARIRDALADAFEWDEYSFDHGVSALAYQRKLVIASAIEALEAML